MSDDFLHGERVFRAPGQATIYDHEPLAFVMDALRFYAEERTYAPSLESKRTPKGHLRAPRRPALRDRGRRAREALAMMEGKR